MPEVKNYDVNQVSLIFGGIPIDSGFGEDDVFSIAPEGDTYGDKAGADGEVTRFATNERRFTLTIKLMQSSDKNAILSALYNLGLLAGNGSDIGALLLKDQNGTSTVAAAKVWIAAPPPMTFGKEVKEYEWKIRGVWDAYFAGGN